MGRFKSFIVLLAAEALAIASVGKPGITRHGKLYPLGEGRELCEDITCAGPAGDSYRWPMVDDCKKLLSDVEAMGENEVFRLENVCESNKNDWELHLSSGSCGVFLRPDTTVKVEHKDRIYWMGKQDIIRLLHMTTTGPAVTGGRLQCQGLAFNCLITDLEEYPVGKQYMEFRIDNPSNFKFPFRTPCQDE